MTVEPKWTTPLEERMQQAEPRLSPRRRKLLWSIVDSAENTYYLSSRELARRHGVDAATIVRTTLQVAYAHIQSKRSLERLKEIDRDEAGAGRWYSDLPSAPEKGWT